MFFDLQISNSATPTAIPNCRDVFKNGCKIVLFNTVVLRTTTIIKRDFSPPVLRQNQLAAAALFTTIFAIV